MRTIFITPDLNTANARNNRLKSLYRDGDIFLTAELSEGFTSIRVPFGGTYKGKSFLRRIVDEVLFGLAVILKSFFYRDSVFILSSPPFFSSLLIGLFFKLTKKKYIIDVRDLYPQVIFDLGIISEDSLVAKLLYSFEKLLYLGSEKVFVATKGLQQSIQARHDLESTVLYNGFSSDYFKSNEKKKVFTVIFHGNMGKLYNIELMIELAELMQNDDVEFLFIGDGEKAEIVKNCQLKNVVYKDRMSVIEVAKEVRTSHYGIAFLINSKMTKKIFPVKVFEFIGCELPFSTYPETEVDLLLKQGSDYSNTNSFLKDVRDKILDSRKSINNNYIRDGFSRIRQAQYLHEFVDNLK